MKHTAVVLAGAVFGVNVIASAQTPPAQFARPQIVAQREQNRLELDQFNIDTRVRANQDIPIGQRTLVDYGAFITLSYLSVNDQQDNTHVLREADIFPYARLNIDGANEIFVRGRFGYQDFNDGDSFNGKGDQPVDGDIDRGYYRFDLARALGAYQGKAIDGDVVFQVGRDLVYWQNGLTLGQVLDGVIIDVSKGPITAETIAGITPTRTVDFDASRPNFDSNTRRGFYGEMVTAAVGDQRPFVYGLFQQDYNEDDFASIGSINTKYEYNSFYIGAGSQGSINDHIVYGAEFVYEGGSSLSNSFKVAGLSLQQVPQQHDEIQAGAADVRLEYLVNDSHKTRFAIEEIIGSGDHDRGNSADTYNGNKPGTKDRSFNAFGLINNGLAFAPGTGNISATRLGVSTFPLNSISAFRRLQVGVDFFLYMKVQENSAIEERTRNDRYLGCEPDLYVNWQVTSDLTLAIRYGRFFADNAVVNNSFDRDYFYGGLTFAF